TTFLRIAVAGVAHCHYRVHIQFLIQPMNIAKMQSLLLAALLALFAMARPSCAQVNVLTQHNDNNRTAANLSETVLTKANVNANRFGKLFARPVDGLIFAQPLYVSNLVMGAQGTHNVVFVATNHAKVYAFDADTAVTSLWSANLQQRSYPANTPAANS